MLGLELQIKLFLVFHRKTEKPGTLPEKEFIHRNSLLTDLFEVKHIKTIYDIFIVMLIILMLNTLVHDFVAEGT